MTDGLRGLSHYRRTSKFLRALDFAVAVVVAGRSADNDLTNRWFFD